jgi:hypothetical protein
MGVGLDDGRANEFARVVHIAPAKELEIFAFESRVRV